MFAAGGKNRHRGIGGSAAERVGAIGVGAENGGIAVGPQFNAPLETVAAVQQRSVVFELIEVAERADDGAVGGVEGFEQTVAVPDCRLSVVGAGEQRRAANVTDHRLVGEM